jgi:ribonuclease HI
MGFVAMLYVYCDGSGTIAEGPACIGVALFEVPEPVQLNPLAEGHLVLEVSEHVGAGTSNYAELRAMRRALWALREVGGPDVSAVLFCDSEYAIRSTRSRWEPTANMGLILAIREQWRELSEVRVVQVKGHSGVYGNELADWLAGQARRRLLGQSHRKRTNPEKCLEKQLRSQKRAAP